MTILLDQNAILCSCNVIQEGHILEIFQIYIFMIDMVGKMRRKKLYGMKFFKWFAKECGYSTYTHIHKQDGSAMTSGILREESRAYNTHTTRDRCSISCHHLAVLESEPSRVINTLSRKYPLSQGPIYRHFIPRRSILREHFHIFFFNFVHAKKNNEHT